MFIPLSALLCTGGGKMATLATTVTDLHLLTMLRRNDQAIRPKKQAGKLQ